MLTFEAALAEHYADAVSEALSRTRTKEEIVADSRTSLLRSLQAYGISDPVSLEYAELAIRNHEFMCAHDWDGRKP
jgi:hypothetical protein